MGYSLWGRKELDMTERLSTAHTVMDQFCDTNTENLIQYLYLYNLLKLFSLFFWPCGMQDLSSLIWDQTCDPCSGSLAS